MTAVGKRTAWSGLDGQSVESGVDVSIKKQNKRKVEGL
jgi:hypothetical protein